MCTDGAAPSVSEAVILDSSKHQTLSLVYTNFLIRTLFLSAGSGPAKRVLCES